MARVCSRAPVAQPAIAPLAGVALSPHLFIDGMKLSQHLTMRVAWHDAKWNGTVCRQPSANPYCVALERVRAARLDEKEDRLRERHWSTLQQHELPPCIAESGGFMSPVSWTRQFRHPYQDNDKATDTHGHLEDTDVEVPAYASFAVPFAWMLKENGRTIEARVPGGLPPDETPPFPTAWVFGRARQDALLDHMFGHPSDDTVLAGRRWSSSIRR